MMKPSQKLRQRPSTHIAHPRYCKTWCRLSRQWKLGAKQCPPRVQRLAIFALSSQIDRQGTLASRLRERSCRRLFLPRIHHVADWRPKTCRVLPCVAHAVGQRGEEGLELVIEATAERRRETFERHHLKQKRRLHRLLMVIIPILHHTNHALPLAAVGLMRRGRLFFVNFRIRFDPFS